MTSSTVLELGAGPGLVSAVLARLGIEVIATDYDPKILSLASRNLRRNHKRVAIDPSGCVDLSGGGVRLRRLDWRLPLPPPFSMTKDQTNRSEYVNPVQGCFEWHAEDAALLQRVHTVIARFVRTV